MKLIRFIGMTLLVLLFSGKALLANSKKPVDVKVGLLFVQLAAEEKKRSIEFTALRRIFDILGIPYDILNDTSALEEYRVLYTGGALTNTVASAALTNALYDYVEMGGTLVSAGEVGNRLFPIFGVGKHFASKMRYRMTFVGADQSLIYIDHPDEQTISLGNGEKHFYDEVIWSHGYTLLEGAVPIATFNDGTVGFSTNRYGRGRTYLFGLTYTESVLRPQIGKDYEAQRQFVNTFEPSADVIMLILKAIYEANYSPFVYISTIPYAMSTALILSHDVDAQTSFVDSLKFAALEERYGVKSTFFENTKYFVDWMDIDYYNIKENVDAIRELKHRGWEIGSHTVSHYKKFSTANEGEPGVTFKTYDPKNRVTVQGEVRVSKELLDRDISGQNTISFRAGDLAFPNNLIRVLEDAGYLYDSTFSANDVLTAFPYFALEERELDSAESNVIEIPVTLDDALGYLTPKAVEKATEQWLDVSRAHMNNEAITVLLIHPSDTRTRSYKLNAQEGLMKGILEMGGWMGDLSTFGHFWRGRHDISFYTYLDGRGFLIIEIDRKKDELNQAIGFVVGNTKIKKIEVMDSTGNKLNYNTQLRGSKMYLGQHK
jgi:peptidoglycan/xylan/chitin deacetylase (PgdA/CDA1 family)